MDLDASLVIFIDEARDLLKAMEDALLSLEGQEPDADTINAMFRAAHTIKGSAGLFGLTPIVAFTHVVENVLDRIRDGKLGLDDELANLMFACRDHMEKLIDATAAGQLAAGDPEGDALLQRLQVYLEGPVVAAKDSASPAQAASSAQAGTAEEQGPRARTDCWHLSLRFGSDVLRNGMDPLSFVSYLGTLGEIAHIHPIVDGLPTLEAFDPESCYLGFELDFRGETDKETLESAFEFVRDDCAVRILPPRAKLTEYINLIQELPEGEDRLGEILVSGGALTRHELEEAIRLQRQDILTHDEPRRLGEIIVDNKLAPAPAVAAALEKQRPTGDASKGGAEKFIKVEARKLDTLIKLIGELVIASAGTNLLALRTLDAELIERSSNVLSLVEQIRDGTLNLRMVQIGETFQRFRRVVRDVSKDLGKQIDLVIEGAETELDKSMVEKLGDPIMHIVRNAMDHGIEPSEMRVYRGKPANGTLRLNAYHDSGSIVIEISDDGGGLNRDKIFAKAVEKGLVDPQANLTDSQVFQLIFAAGFSTAEQVTNLSGRGVGMDVVRRNIEDLKGAIEIYSEEGVGTTFELRLPLTLAIIDGFLVEVAGAAFVVPLDLVIECVDLEAVEHDGQRNYFNLRGDLLPYVRLGDLFDVGGEPERENVVVVQYGGVRAGLVVNGLRGELQAVIKPLGHLFRGLRGIGGSTILGSGEVALILDVPQLIHFAASAESSEIEARRLKRAANA